MTEPAAPSPNLAAVHELLRAILAPYRGRLRVANDGPGGMTLELPEYAGQPWGFAAGTRLGKRYVSYYLMPVYVQPALVDDISPALRKRMQGKSCFNFARVDEPLLAELESLTKRGYEATAGDPAWGAERRAAGSQRSRRA